MTDYYFIQTREVPNETDANELSPLSDESSPSPLADMLGAEQKHQDLESLTLILKYLDHGNEATHNEELKQGMATFLIQVLHKTLRRTHPGDIDSLNVYRDHIGGSRAVRVSIICSALEMVFRCSDAAMNSFVDTLPAETLPTLVILVEIFAAQNGSHNTARDVVLNKVARILNRLCTHGIPIRIVVVEALFVLLKGPTDTRIDAASALARLAARRNDRLHHCTIPRIEKVSRSLITTLTIAASSLPKDQVEDVLDALLHLANSSDAILVNIARRAGTLRVLGQCMKSARPEIRRNSFMIAERLLTCIDGFTELFAGQPLNGKVLSQGLASAVQNESEAELQHFVTCLLTKTLANMNGSLYHAEIITDALAIIASAAIQDRTAHEAALGLCNKAPALKTSSCQENACVAVSELAQSSSTLVRSEALRALGKLCSQPVARRFLAGQDSFQKAIASNMTEGSEEQASTVMSILDQLVCEQQNREAICHSSILLDLLVDMVISNNTTTTSAHYMTSVQLLLHLMSDDTSIKCFLHYAELLPWLATLANSNTSSKELKNDTVDAIVRLTSQFLEA